MIGKGLYLWHLRCTASVLCPWYHPGDSVPKTVIGESKSLETHSARRSPRIRLQIPVFVRGADASGAEFIELTKTLNISAFGACIACQHVLRPNQSVQLTIPTPSPVSSSLVPSETPPIIARVLRQNMVGETRLFGLEFIHPLD
jgi:PilZ domain-containing protein